jgi:hypothetical protein
LIANVVREIQAVTGDEPGVTATGGMDVSRLNTGIPHPARVYDVWLGGKDNFAADRAAAEAGLQAFPSTIKSVRANRAFLARAVRYLIQEQGLRQLLDIGTGLPSANDTHEVAQAVAPDTRVVYVDNDHYKSGCSHACWAEWAIKVGYLTRDVAAGQQVGTSGP